MIFGSTLTFVYAAGDSLASGTTLTLQPDQMPAYPFETSEDTDKISYRSKSGRKYEYENYNLDVFTFTWNLIDSATRDSLKLLYDSRPLVSISSGGTNYGTFRLSDTGYKDSMSAFGLYDIALTFEEENTL